ncbi:VOC family protein [Bacillus sp. B15-48]|uniref:VOC family protein n=1 Tax=Bacillus sp. B15-48 TaxID=1548601 RepID=UPI00193F3936|nr:VOC family protein [Bacillus sp. B15-48]MBM4763361.1 glyoxalase [Bacillus sp. B15-48]
MTNGFFTQVLQVGIVVDDLEAYMKKYEQGYGFADWKVKFYNEENTKVHQEEKQFSIKVGFTNLGNIQFELIQPLDETSVYAEFLREHGPGLHHLAFATDNHDDTCKEMDRRGIPILQSGESQRGTFTYLDLRRELGFIGEIYK